MPKSTNAALGILAILYVAAEAFMLAVSGLTLWPLVATFGMSLVAIGQYGIDKSSAQRGQWRIAEANFRLVAILGGWPGAVLAQQLFHHKTQKRSFQTAFRVAVAVNVLATIAIDAVLITT